MGEYVSAHPSPLEKKFGIEIDPNAPVYEDTSLIPIKQPTFFFNQGHVSEQLRPYLPELVAEYGAQIYKVNSPSKSKMTSISADRPYEVFVGISPDALFDWTAKRINEGAISDVFIDIALALLAQFPTGNLYQKLEEMAKKRVDVQAVATIIFGFRQQLGQYFKPEHKIVVIEKALEAGQIEIAQSQLTRLERGLVSMQRQYTAGRIFVDQLVEFLLRPGNKRRIESNEVLSEELEVMAEIVDAVEAIVTEETIYWVQVEKLKGKINPNPGSQTNLQ